MPKPDPRAEKLAALHQHHALNPRPQRVTDPSFTAGAPFFDPRDLVQVKYEMLRSVRREGRRTSQAARAFGFSRPSFYQIQALFDRGGLPALLPQRPGPRRAHKLSEAVVDLLEQALVKDPTLRATQLADLVRQQRNLEVHPRSIERALTRRRKKGLQ